MSKISELTTLENVTDASTLIITTSVATTSITVESLRTYIFD